MACDDAKMDHQPVVAIVGQAARSAIGVDRAIRIAESKRTVTCIIVPNDLQEIAAEEPAALAANCPCVLEAITDPDVPPLAPHITLEQARKFTSTLIKGDPHEGGIIRQSAREFIESILPH